jgi:hypothetical protein
VRTSRGLWVVDLLSRGGISVNGAGVRFARLDVGDQLQVGDYLIGIRSMAPAPNALTDQRGLQPMLQGPTAAPAPAHRNGHKHAISDVPGVRPGLSSSGVATKSRSASKQAGAPDQPGDNLLDPLPLGQWMPEVLGPMDPSAAILFEQFGSMQKQMFDQFEQFVTMMCQTMGALHQDQTALVRDELAQIRRLTQELAALKDEQLSLAVSSLASSVPGILEDTPADAPAPNDNGTARPAQPRRSSANGKVNSENGHSTAAAESPARETRSAAWEPKRGNGAHAAQRTDEPPLTQTSEEIHSLLTRRIAAIQQEQRGRLQKLFGLVTRR